MAEPACTDALSLARSPSTRRTTALLEQAGCLLRPQVLALAFVACSAGAMAQTPAGPLVAQAPVVQPGPPTLNPSYQTPNEREAENYAPRGVRVGTFLLFPSLELDEMYDDNIFINSTSGTTPQQQTGSFIQIIKPSVELRSEWAKNMLNFYARGAFGFYTAAPGLNFQDLSVGTDGRLDIKQTANIFGGASFNRLHEALGTPNAPTNFNQVNYYNQISANAGYFQQFGKIRTTLEGRLDNYNFTNNGLGPAQGVIFNSDRDRTEFHESFRVGYEFLQGYEIWTRGSLNQRVYVTNPDALGFFHNSTGWDLVGGFSVAISSITSLEFFAGYLQQNYVDPAFATVAIPTFGLTGYWSPTRQILVKPYVLRTVDDTSLGNASGYIDTTGGVDVTYDFRPNIKIQGHADYTSADYNTVAGSLGRLDQYYTFRGGVLYSPTEHFFIGPTYQFEHRTSNQAGLDFNDNQIMLRLGAQL
jgi:hypothetical protein